MKTTVVALACVALSAPAWGGDEGVQTVREDLSFAGFHDPGYLKLEDRQGNSIKAYFYYDFISYEDVQRWREGEMLRVVVKPSAGAGVVRGTDHRFHKVVFDVAEHPIGILEEQCLSREKTTIGIADCYRASDRWWEDEFAYLFRRLIRKSSGELASKLRRLDEAWTGSREAFFDAYRVRAGEAGGTIWQISGAVVGRRLRRDQVEALLAFYE